MKPKTTFTEFIQPPLFGNFWSKFGNMANSANGKAKATEKANMQRMGVQMAPCVDCISTVPTMGPVHENDTSTKVKAMKKIPPKFLVLCLLSLLFNMLLPRVISKAPKNEAAKIMNTKKNIKFGIQFVASQLNIPAVTPSPPTK